jgi:heme A synthase
MVPLSGLLSLLVTLVVAALIFWLIWWFIDYVGVPEPFNKVIRVVIGLVALIFLINLLLGGIGHPIFRLN